MSTSFQNSPAETDNSMDAFFSNEGFDPRQAVMPSIDLPIPYGYNPMIGTGKGGLFFPKGIVPADIVINPKFAQEFVAEWKDPKAPRGVRTEDGFLLERYQLLVIDFDKNENGSPQIQRVEYEGKVKWVIYVVAICPQFYSPSKPFKIKFSGSNAFAMKTHLENFLKVIGEATAIKQRKAASQGMAAIPAMKIQFLLPCSHQILLVGSGEKTSFCARLNEFTPESLSFNNSGKANGKSVLDAYITGATQEDRAKGITDDEVKAKNLSKLLVTTSVNGKEYFAKALEFSKLYENAVTVVKSDRDFGGNSNSSKSESSFTTDENLAANARQIAEIADLAAIAGLDADREVQWLRGRGDLKGGDDTMTRFSLTQPAANVLIQHLKSKQPQAAPQQSQQPVQQTQQTTGYQAPVAPAYGDDDEIPFLWLVGLFTSSYFVLSALQTFTS